MNKEKEKQVKKLPGFYIALCCCVFAIGLAGYFTERNTDEVSSVMNTEVTEEKATEKPVFSADMNKYSTNTVTATPVTNMPNTETVPAADPVPAESKAVEEYAVDNPDIEDNAVTVSSEQPAFIMPVTGNILGEYSDKLVYNNALADWRTHNGIDISAENGCSVQSAADGVVDKIWEDAMGNCVEISHAGGFVTRYMGLESVENLSEGREIKSGEVIGTVGDCKGENVTDSHLHFEMDNDGQTVNPSEYLPH